MLNLRRDAEGIIISVKVQPKSSTNKIVGDLGGELKIAIKQPPEKGKANKELVSFLAYFLL